MDRRYVGIDPSTKTGFVVVDGDGEVWEAEEIAREGRDPDRLISLIDAITALVLPGDIVCIEDFAYAKGHRMALLGGIGWGIRTILRRRGIQYHEVATGQLKNFAGAKGNCGKEDLIIPIYDLWGFRNGSDNVRDAFILAQICRSLYEPGKLYKYQQDVLTKIKTRGSETTCKKPSQPRSKPSAATRRKPRSSSR
ncbi:hypothetical protein [Paenibacillus lycopersici]|uniref:hypothetical protein n=1 Tax=Paenibacillus lycopersici TaxID=2704462 RepID=UPI001CDB6E9B|nr:hypothetical protein [Paenibacillus lycopersici]